MLYDNPQFNNSNDGSPSINWDFSLEDNSPCINSGNPELFDIDGTISDIGAIIFLQNCPMQGDANGDYEINILDVVQTICLIINSSDNNCEANSQCTDLNQDNIINVLDIVALVNLIIN